MSDSPKDIRVLTIVQQLKSGVLQTSALDRETRKAVVAWLTGEGWNVPEIASLLTTSDRTVQRDRSELREALSLLPSPELVGQLVGQLMQTAEQCTANLRRMARDKSTPVAQRIDAEQAIFNNACKLIATLQSLGYLPAQAVFTGDDLGSDGDIQHTQVLAELRHLLVVTKQQLPADDPDRAQLDVLNDVIQSDNGESKRGA